jgi:Holliday junction resolvase RusA-like endonuclease
MTIRLELPRPPSANNLYRNVPGKGRVRSSEYRRWQQQAGWMLQVAQPGRITGAVAVHYLIPNAADRRRRDIDNLAKPLNDLLVKHGVIEDDSRVRAVTLEYGDTETVVATVAEATA